MKKHYREVIYLLGDSEEKHRAMHGDLPGVARARGAEITSVCRMEGRDYYVVGEHPFGGFTAMQYVRYERSLIDRPAPGKAEIKALLRKLGAMINVNKRMRALSFLDRRLVALAARITPETRTLVIDLDGVPYSRALRSSLRRAAKRLSRDYEVWISVTDCRFTDKRASVAEMKKGDIIALGRRIVSRPLSRRLLLARLRRCFAPAEEPIEKGRITEVKSEPAHKF